MRLRLAYLPLFCFLGLFFGLATTGCSVLGREQRSAAPLRSVRGEALSQRDRLDMETEAPMPRPLVSAAIEEEELRFTPPVPAPVYGVDAAEGTGQAAEHSPLQTSPAPTPQPEELESLSVPIAHAATPQQAGSLRCVEQGRLLLASGQRERAREWFEKALSLDPNNPYAYYFLAQLALRNQRPDQAHAFVTRALQMANRLDARWRSRFEALQGEIFEQVGRFADARRSYQQAAEWDPENSSARAGLARLGAP